MIIEAADMQVAKRDCETERADANHIVCNLCDADDYRVVFAAGQAQVHQIVRCNQCGLMYANPRVLLPDFEGLKRPPAGSESWLAAHRFRLPKELRQVRDYRDTLNELGRMFPNRGKLVEIGSGTGSLLNFFRADGWRVEGVDPWAEGCLYAATKYDIKAYARTFDEVGFPDESFDVVLMIHVIEHMLDPAANLAEAYRVLKPGGVLVVETPCYDSLTFGLLGRRERSISCNGHIYFFTTRTLKSLGEKAGLSVNKAVRVGRSLSLDRLAWNLGVVSKSTGLQRAIGSIAAWLRFDRIWLYINLRDMQRMYFLKNQ